MARKYKHTSLPPPYLKRIWIDEEKVPDREACPFCLPMFREPNFELELDTPVTIIVGENGSGKSTLLEALPLLLASMAKAAVRACAQSTTARPLKRVEMHWRSR